MFDFDNFNPVCKIKVIGVGGAGNNAVNCMHEQNIIGCEFYALNTDAQILGYSKVENRLVLGQNITKGLGAGANPAIGEQAALANEEDIRKICEGADMVFVAAGMGGGTGTGAAPVVAKIAKECGALVVGIVTRPFTFEGKIRMNNAQKGLENLKEYCDTLIVISNDRILQLIGNLPIKASFKEADNVLRKSVQSITDLISTPSTINLDFADVRTIMSKKGSAMIGFGVGKGEKKIVEAASKAITSPLLEHSITGAHSAILSIVGGATTSLYDFLDVVEYVKKSVGNDINIIFGCNTNDELQDEIQVTIIATEFDDLDEVSSKVEFDPNFVRKPIVSPEKVEEYHEPTTEIPATTETTEFVPDFFRKK